MKRTVHNSRAKLATLEAAIYRCTAPERTAFQLSSVKRNGTVIAKFRSTEHADAESYAAQFIDSFHSNAVTIVSTVCICIELDKL